MKVVHIAKSSTYLTVGMGCTTYARREAARICAELHLLTYPGAYIEKVNERTIGRGVLSQRVWDYNVCSDAPKEMVQKAIESYTFSGMYKGKFSIKDRAYVWGLKEFYAQEWVQAFRLLCVAGQYEMAEEARQNYGHIEQLAFANELKASPAEIAQLYKSFYFGGEETEK